MKKDIFLNYCNMVSPFLNWSEVAERSGITTTTISTYTRGNGDNPVMYELIAYYAWIIIKEKQKQINKITRING